MSLGFIAPDNTLTGPSANLWNKIGVPTILMDPSAGYGFFDDFDNCPNLSADADDDKYASYIDTGGTITQIDALLGGAVRITTDTTDNDECWIQAGGNTGSPFVLDNGYPRLVWEARIRINQIVTQNVFIGLADVGSAAADGIFTDGDAIQSSSGPDLLGFRILAADADGLDATFATAGTEVVMKDVAQLVVASTWYKVGGYFDGKYYYPYVAGLPIVCTGGSSRTADNKGVSVESTSFPDAQGLNLCAGVKNGAGAATSLDIDWWYCFQQRGV